MTALLAEVENSVYRLANAIRKTQRRANALENIVIPRYEETAKFITDALEEKDREEFSHSRSSRPKNSRRHKTPSAACPAGGGFLWRIRILQARGYWQTPRRMVT